MHIRRMSMVKRPVHGVNVLGERNDAEDGVDVHECDAMLAIGNEPDDVDALHDAGEVIESFPKRCSASIRVRRELANGVWMQRKRGGVVVPHCIDILLDHLYHLFAHETPQIKRLLDVAATG